jgi:uncharacterized protein YggE
MRKRSPVGSLVVLAIVLAAPAPLIAQAAPPDVPVIVTTGEGVVRQAPDVAYLTIGVESRAKSPRDAQSQNGEAMTAVQQRLLSAGVPREAIKTVGFSLHQEFDLVNGRQVPREYVARNGVELRLDDVKRVGEIVDLAVQGGATTLDGLRFDLKDRTAAEREAVRLAVADARGRAEAAAAGAGRTLDRILRIEDARVEPGIPRPFAVARVGVAPPSPVEPGLLDVQAHVTLTVSMK